MRIDHDREALCIQSRKIGILWRDIENAGGFVRYVLTGLYDPCWQIHAIMGGESVRPLLTGLCGRLATRFAQISTPYHKKPTFLVD